MITSQPAEPASRVRWWRWVTVVLAGVAVLVAGLVVSGVPAADDVAVLAPVVLIAGQVAAVLVPPVPAWPSTAAGVFLYGPWVGFALSFTGAVTGSLAAFGASRRFGWAALRRVGGEKYAAVPGKTNGLWLIPVLALPVPAGGDVACFLAGLTPMRLHRFVLMACVGRIPGTALGVLTASGVTTGSLTAVIAAVAGSAILFVLARYWRSRASPATKTTE